MKQCVMSLHALELDVFLGWPEEERAQKQTVWIDIDLQFANAPKACESDDLDDTVCYDTLVQTIRKFVHEKQFRLIEHLVREVFHLVRKNVPQDTNVVIRIKKKPEIEGLLGGVSVICGD